MIIHYHPLSHDQTWDKGNSTISRFAFPDAIFQPCRMLDHWRVWIMSLHCHNPEDLPWPRSGPCINGPSMTCRGTCSSFLAWLLWPQKLAMGFNEMSEIWQELQRNLTLETWVSCCLFGQFEARKPSFLGFLWFPAVCLNFLLPYPKSSECVLLGIALNELVDAVDEPRKFVGLQELSAGVHSIWFYMLGQLFIYIYCLSKNCLKKCV